MTIIANASTNTSAQSAPAQSSAAKPLSITTSREAFATQKSASFDLVDACTQANLSYDVITYDSDDEMVKSRRGIPFGGLRNKKGHPIYSREDIREQYCITRKELDVLEHNLRDSSAARLFGCLSSSHMPDSHCNKSSFLLLSCVQRRKNSSEFDEESDSGNKSLENTKSGPLRAGLEEDDSSDGGFKQRISASNPITRTIKRIEKTETTNSYSNEMQSYSRQSSKYYPKSGLERSGSSFDSERTNEPQMPSPLKRPTKLYFTDNMETCEMNATTTTSHSVDELNDHQSMDCLSWRGSQVAKTPDTGEDNRNINKKHVTFAATHLVRSATVGGINNIHISPPNQPISERLVNESTIQVNGSHMMRKTDSMDMFDQRSSTSSRDVSDFLPLYRAAMRRAVMKTQATQTDTTSKRSANWERPTRRSIPAYLTLSPRTSKPETSEGFYADYYDSDGDDDDEDVLQISLKDKKTRKIQRTRTSEKTKSKSRRKQRSIAKSSPQTSKQHIDIQTNSDDLGFQRLDSSHSESSRIESMIRKEDLNSKSSTDSNQLELISSATNELDSSYRSIRSQDSTTVVSELNDSSILTNEDKQRLIDEINDDFVDDSATDVTKRPLIIDPKKAVLKTCDTSSITSPDSDNYSFAAEHKTFLVTDVSNQGSSSPPVDNIDSGGSSVYVSANDTSPQIDKDKASGQTSFETASSGSRFSSPPSVENKANNSDKETDFHSIKQELHENFKSFQSKTSRHLLSVKPTEDIGNEKLIPQLSETIDPKERTVSPESTVSTHNSTEHNIEDFDSEDVGDVTPVQDLSTDTSTAVETSTVIENPIKTSVKPKIPPKPTFLLGDQKINLTQKPLPSCSLSVESVSLDTESELQSDDNEDVIDDVSGGDFIVRRNMSGELSTVSEVSEEISLNGKSHKSDSGSGIQMTKIDRKSANNDNNEANVMSSSDAGDNRSNTPSIAESTTSGSFMIDGNLTDPNSLSESIERPKLEKSGSFPSVLTDNIETSFTVEGSIILEKTSNDTNEKALDKSSEPTSVEPPVVNHTIITSDIINETNDAIKKLPNSISAKQITISNNNDSIDLKSKISEKKEDLNGKLIDNSGDNKRNLTKSRTESCDLGRHLFTCEEWKAIGKRRSRSLSKSPDKSLSRIHERTHSCNRHHYQCRQCGERAVEPSVPLVTVNKGAFSFQNFKSFSIDTTYHNNIEDDEDIGIHTESYRSALWLYVGRKDELTVWGHKCHKKNHKNKVNGSSPSKLVRQDSNESTLSERQFRRQYESVTHRMIHRRASIEMYKRAINKTFEIEKEIIIHRINNEFGFRIHGSRPVVVSAIEKDTPAETCGLDVGDIVVTINGSNVMECSHSEVVKLAHSGADTLRLEVVSTRPALNRDGNGESEINGCDIVINGYLTRLSTDSKGNKWHKNRWFALKTDTCLYWYKSTKEMDPLGVICLQGYTACCAPELSVEQPFALKLAKPGSDAKYLAAKDSETVNQWVDAINQRANHLNKSDPYVEIALKNIGKSAIGLGVNDCSGYLAIFSQRRKVWRNRYFVLKDASLYFYYDSNANTSLGVFFLHGYRVQSCVLIAKKNTFEAIPPESKFRHLWLMAESDVDKKRWLSALEYSIDRWIRL